MARWRVYFIVSVLVVYCYYVGGIALAMTNSMKPSGGLGLMELLANLSNLNVVDWISRVFVGQWYFLLVLIAAILPFAFRHGRKLEPYAFILAISCLLIPAVWSALESGGLVDGLADLLMAPLIILYLAIIAPIHLLAGTADGEFYNEGFVCYSAYGWWLIVWVVAAVARSFEARSGEQVS